MANAQANHARGTHDKTGEGSDHGHGSHHIVQNHPELFDGATRHGSTFELAVLTRPRNVRQRTRRAILGLDAGARGARLCERFSCANLYEHVPRSRAAPR